MAKIHELYLQLIDDIEKDRSKFLANVTEENINKPNEDSGNQTLLHMSIAMRDFDTAVALLRKGAKYDLLDTYNLTAIDYAILYQNKKFILELNKKELIDPDTPDSDGCTPLYWAAKNGNKDLIELWLKLGANTHIINNDEITILNAANDAVNEDFITNLRLLLKWGIGIKNDFTGVRLFDEITEGCIILKSSMDGKPLTRQTPGCQNAYTNLEEIKEAINTGKKINIMCKTSVFEQHLSDPDVYNVYKLLTSPSTNLRNKLLFFINDHPEKIKSLEFLPDEFKTEVAAPITLSSNNSS